jgi:hypothetical protein
VRSTATACARQTRNAANACGADDDVAPRCPAAVGDLPLPPAAKRELGTLAGARARATLPPSLRAAQRVR